MRIYIFLSVFLSLLVYGGYKPIVIPPGYEHDKWVTLPADHIFEFGAFTASFDGTDDNNGDGSSDLWGVPEWVAYEIKGNQPLDKLPRRPRWMTDQNLYNQGIAPNDYSYGVSGTSDMREVKTDYRYVRGHMCPKATAERISSDAAYNTHTMINACPQLQWQNNGIWKELEIRCTNWADTYGQIWVVCGPVFFGKNPAVWLGQNGEKQAAVPDAFYKIVIRKDGNWFETLAFLIPNVIPKDKKEPGDFITTIDRIESLTGLDFLTSVEDYAENAIERRTGSLQYWQ